MYTNKYCGGFWLHKFGVTVLLYLRVGWVWRGQRRRSSPKSRNPSTFSFVRPLDEEGETSWRSVGDGCSRRCWRLGTPLQCKGLGWVLLRRWGPSPDGGVPEGGRREGGKKGIRDSWTVYGLYSNLRLYVGTYFVNIRNINPSKLRSP